MKRPKWMWVGAFKYKVQWHKELGNFNAAGATNPELTLILVDPKNDKQVQRETLVHELLHAIWKQTDLRVSMPDDDNDSEGEKIIQRLSPYLYAFIKENPEVVAWLQSQ